MDRLRRAAMFLASFLFVGVWQFASTYLVSPHLIPPPGDVARTAVPMLTTAEIPRHAAASLARVAVGFTLGSALGVVLGVLMGRIAWIHDLLDPVNEFFRFLSPTAMIPIAVIWFGIGETSKHFLILWSTFFVVLAVFGVLGYLSDRVFRSVTARVLSSYLEAHA